MSEIVKNVVRIFAGFTFLFGIYKLLYGHLSPGGGFSSGVIIAGTFILLCIAYGKKIALQKLSQSVSATFMSLGALIFLIIALLGIIGGYFFLNFLPKGKPFDLFSAGIIPICNIGIGLTVSNSLFTIFIVMAMIRVLTRKDGITDYIDSSIENEKLQNKATE